LYFSGLSCAVVAPVRVDGRGAEDFSGGGVEDADDADVATVDERGYRSSAVRDLVDVVGVTTGSSCSH
jgi:hypothetical protein